MGWLPGSPGEMFSLKSEPSTTHRSPTVMTVATSTNGPVRVTAPYPLSPAGHTPAPELPPGLSQEDGPPCA